MSPILSAILFLTPGLAPAGPGAVAPQAPTPPQVTLPPMIERRKKVKKKLTFDGAVAKAEREEKPLIVFVGQKKRRINGCETFEMEGEYRDWNAVRVIVFRLQRGELRVAATIMGKPTVNEIKKKAFPARKRKGKRSRTRMRIPAARYVPPVQAAPVRSNGGGGRAGNC